MNGTEARSPRGTSVAIAVRAIGAALLSQAALAGPAAAPEFDLFDHLATTFPIEDWVTWSRARYDELENAVPDSSARLRTTVDNIVALDRDDSWFHEDASRRRVRSLSWCQAFARPAVVGSPCGGASAALQGKEPLPDRIATPRAASIGLGSRDEQRAMN